LQAKVVTKHLVLSFAPSAVILGVSALVQPYNPDIASSIGVAAFVWFVGVSMTFLHRLRWYLRGLEESPKEPMGQHNTGSLAYDHTRS
jgi:hypothetical protein